MLGLVVNHVFACIWYYLGADDFSEECSTADVPARACTWMQVHGLHPHRTVWNSPPRRVDLISAQAPGQLVPLHHLPVLVSHDAVDCRLRRHEHLDDRWDGAQVHLVCVCMCTHVL